MVDLVAECADLLASFGHKAEVLAASLRNPRQKRETAQVGAHIATLPFAVIEGLLTHDLTMEGMKLFTDDVVPDYAELLRTSFFLYEKVFNILNCLRIGRETALHPFQEWVQGSASTRLRRADFHVSLCSGWFGNAI